ncbi:MAG: DAK2 domain-containing protein [Anaerolineae bacterium]|nr:DAK2 domain-containing protein [Anaerolineae bacterium]
MPDRRNTQFVVDGQDFKQLIRAGLAWLQHHQEAINALNVFPVPDGDTGTNMVLTMRAAWQDVANTPEKNVGHVAQMVAHGALMGARGNSGVILSQIWRGVARGLEGKDVFTAQDLAAATEEGARTAYKGVVRPVEGTILTVARETAEEAAQAAKDTRDTIVVLERMVSRARDAVARTPNMLPVLAEAGVVDAGGQGLYVILEGMLRYLKGESVAEDLRLIRAVDLTTAVHDEGEMGYGYDVQFIIVGQDLNVNQIRMDIDAMGDSTLVVGEPTTVKVHVHVPDPGVPISYAVRLGSLRDVVVEDMQAQYQEFVVGRGHPPVAGAPMISTEIGVVAVAAGEGLARVFGSMGAAAVVHGGQTMNPSTEEILQAVGSIPSKRVIILPNNKNIIMAAQNACDLSDKHVAVIPTRTIPQGIAALLALNYQADLEENAAEMVRAAQEVQTGEVTTATRDVTLSGVKVCEGQVIGIHDGQLVVAGDTVQAIVAGLLEQMRVDDLELVTLYYGQDVSAQDAEELVECLEEKYPEQEFEVVEGGQPHYFYIISAE